MQKVADSVLIPPMTCQDTMCSESSDPVAVCSSFPDLLHQGKQEGLSGMLSLFRRQRVTYWPTDGVESDSFNRRFPDKKKIIEMAEEATKGRIRFWHPWHMELTHTTERLVSPREWFSARNGDQEWVDSLVRFTHMVDLAAAYRLTAKRHYLSAFTRYLESFSSARSFRHRHWSDQLNAALRTVNLIKAVDLIGPSELEKGTLATLINEILTDSQFLVSSLGVRTGNWEVAICTSLLIVSVYLSEVFDNSKIAGEAKARLNKILRSDIHEDGIQVEEVPLYHGEVILFLFDYLTILDSNGLPADSEIVEILKRMLHAMEELADPEGLIPPIGDSDRFPVSYLTHIGELLIPDYVPKKKRAVGKSGTSPQLTVFKETGWSLVQWHSGKSGSNYLFFDCSGKPLPRNSWHAHADDLNFIYHTSQGPLLTDPGRFTYARKFQFYLPFSNVPVGERGWRKHLLKIVRPSSAELSSRDWRDYFKSTLAHNTVSCEGVNQPGYASLKEPGRKVRLVRSELFDDIFVLEGELDTRKYSHKLTESPPSQPSDKGYLHRRGIYGLLPGTVVIVDRLYADEPHDWVNSLHFSPGVQLHWNDSGLKALLGNSCFSVFFANDPSPVADTWLDDDWVSEVYNRKVASRTCRSRIAGSANAVFVTVINAVQDPETDVTVIELQKDSSRRVESVKLQYRMRDGNGRLVISLGDDAVETRISRERE